MKSSSYQFPKGIVIAVGVLGALGVLACAPAPCAPDTTICPAEARYPHEGKCFRTAQDCRGAMNHPGSVRIECETDDGCPEDQTCASGLCSQ